MTYSHGPANRDGVEVLSLVGPFTLNNLFHFQRDLQEIRPPYLIFDITHVPYMDSAALGLLVNFYVSAQKHGRKMAITGTNPRVLTLFQMTKLDGLFRLYATVEEAEAAG